MSAPNTAYQVTSTTPEPSTSPPPPVITPTLMESVDNSIQSDQDDPDEDTDDADDADDDDDDPEDEILKPVCRKRPRQARHEHHHQHQHHDIDGSDHDEDDDNRRNMIHQATAQLRLALNDFVDALERYALQILTALQTRRHVRQRRFVPADTHTQEEQNI
eukprot:c9527_g1_i3.p1 GENE.c9527_g1_i3~~c9527_g1_i3.p1  ORF type:complete len:161 (+),score=46.56 c9527_g1_i3:133-615(+)